MKRYIAIDLGDFHEGRKYWQGGTEESVKIKTLSAPNLKKAKEYAHLIDTSKAWLVVESSTTKNIAYADIFSC